MKTNPLLKEIRDIRDAMYAQFGNDSEAWLDHLAQQRSKFEAMGFKFISATLPAQDPNVPTTSARATPRSAKGRTTRKTQTA
jgi:hypothetical protein